MPDKPVPAWAEKELALRREVESWTVHTIDRQRAQPWRGRHDEGSFVSSWFGFCLLSGDNTVKDFLYSLREGFIDWSRRNLYHGYAPEGECHHHTEIFTDWFVYYSLLDKNDTRCAEVTEDAAEHIGNWSPDVPEWYDWQKHMFRSWWLGTKVVRAEPPYDYNSFDTWHLTALALYAYQITGKSRYLELCEDFFEPWRDLFLRNEGPPQLVRFPVSDPEELARIYWSQEGVGVDASLKASYLYPNQMGDDWQSYRDSYQTTFLGYTGAIYSSLARFSQLSGTTKYVPVLKKIVDTKRAYAGEKAAYGGYAVPVNYSEMVRYRDLSGEACYDADIAKYEAQCVEDWKSSPPVPSILLLDHVSLRAPWDAWMKWAYRDDGGRIVECPDALGSPIVVYQRSGNKDVLAHAMEHARVRLRMALFSLRDGREHGCAARHFIHGPGGAAAGLLTNLTVGWNGFDGQDPTRVLYYDGSGRLGLPKQVAALLEPETTQTERLLLLYNAGSEELELMVEVKNSVAGVSAVECDVAGAQDGMRYRLALPPGKEIRVRIALT